MTVKEAQIVSNGIDMEALDKTVNEVKGNPELGRCQFRIYNKWESGGRNSSEIDKYLLCGKETSHKSKFISSADEPEPLGGKDSAANPVEHLLHALASCVTTSIAAHAAVNGIEIERLESRVEGDIDLRGFFGLARVPRGYQQIRVRFKVKTDPKNIENLRKLVEFSPVYNTLTLGTDVFVEIESE